ncbi:MAG: HAD-IA family hydrolase [Bacteroidetes bacterium]|jgi:sugar-phosphatase|nr:HAD-IA family hydrolase [Bacteroidota bacterium]
MTLTCKAIIFDLDGVLVDSNAISERHWQRWARERGIPYDEIAAGHHGRPTVEIIQDVAPHLDAEAEAENKEGREATDTEGLTAFEGAHALTDQLPDGRWTVATSGRRRTATHRLAHVGLPEPETLVTADDITDGKPAPDPYLLAAERLGVAPQDCVVFEDAPAGVEAAQRAGAQVVAVTSTNDASALSAADAVVRRLADVRITADGDGGFRVQPKARAQV